jgi:hypothetical protein
MVLLRDQDDQDNSSAQDRVAQVNLPKAEGISVNQMLQKRISKRRNEAQNINSLSSLQKTKKTSINSVVLKVS